MCVFARVYVRVVCVLHTYTVTHTHTLVQIPWFLCVTVYVCDCVCVLDLSVCDCCLCFMCEWMRMSCVVTVVRFLHPASRTHDLRHELSESSKRLQLLLHNVTSVLCV